MGGGPDGDLVDLAVDLAPQGVHQLDLFHLVAEEVNAQGFVFFVGGEDLDDVAADAEGTAGEADVVAFKLALDELPQEHITPELAAHFHIGRHLFVALARADAIDAADGGDNDDVVAFEDGLGGAVAHAVDGVVDQAVFFDERVRRRDIRLGLVIVVVADEVLDGVVGKERLQLLIELGGQGLVVGEQQRGAIHPLDDVGDGEGLARAGDTQEHLVGQALVQTVDEAFDGDGLVPLGHVVGHDPKGPLLATGPQTALLLDGEQGPLGLGVVALGGGIGGVAHAIRLAHSLNRCTTRQSRSITRNARCASIKTRRRSPSRGS